MEAWKKIVYKTKNELALEMLRWALDNGFPKCTVLADSWFGVGPFIKGLRRMKLNYVVEIKPNLNARVASKEPKFTPMGNRGFLQERQATNGYGGSHC